MNSKPRYYQKTAREVAYLSLLRCEKDKSYSNLEIDSAIKKHELIGAEKRLYTTLVYGVIERRVTLDYIIELLSSKPLEKLDTEVITVLRMGLYQMIYLDKVPSSAAVNESVKLIKNTKQSAAGFVNALLREYERKYQNKIPLPDKKDMYKYLTVKYSCGRDVVELISAYPEPEKILESLNCAVPVTLRVNTLKTSRDELINKLSENKITAEISKFSPYGIKLETLSEFVRELIENGECFVQDEASQIACEVLSPSAGDTVIDVCACPGGKAFGAAMKMENNGKITAFDLHQNKLSLIDSGAKRLGINIITSNVKDGTKYDPELFECADKIICDVPCSGLGVMAKKPEIRYKTFDEIAKLPTIQSEILKNASKYLKAGGRICYSTCTLNPAENESVVRRFLAANKNFKAVDFEIGEISSRNGMLTLFPQNGTDGFFISLLEKCEKGCTL